MPPQVKNMINCHKVTCDCGICISASTMQSKLNSWILRQIAKLVFFSKITLKNIRSREEEK